MKNKKTTKCDHADIKKNDLVYLCPDCKTYAKALPEYVSCPTGKHHLDPYDDVCKAPPEPVEDGNEIKEVFFDEANDCEHCGYKHLDGIKFCSWTCECGMTKTHNPNSRPCYCKAPPKPAEDKLTDLIKRWEHKDVLHNQVYCTDRATCCLSDIKSDVTYLLHEAYSYGKQDLHSLLSQERERQKREMQCNLKCSHCDDILQQQI